MAFSDWSAADWPTLAIELRRTPTDQAAWQEAIKRLREIAKRVLVTWKDRGEEPDDLANEVLVKLIIPESRTAEAMHALRSMHAPEAYLASIMRNALLSRIRREKIDRRALSLLFPDQLSGFSEFAGFNAEEQEALNREIHRLSTEEQELLRLKFWEGLSNGEIALNLNISYSTASVRLFRLLRKLRGVLAHSDHLLK